jgi:tripartite-type tricarboxylate transporter receptor subunit TctC
MNPITRPHGRFEQSRRRILRIAAIAATASIASVNLSFAQGLPQTTRIVVPFPAGSPVEASMRALVQALNQTSGRTYIVDNKPGAGGLLGATEVAKGKPDGSLLLHVTGGHTSTPSLYSKLPYDAVGDFTAVTQLLTAPGFGLLVRANSPYRTVQDLIKAAQDKPNSVSYASLGNGNTTHLIGALFARATKAEFMHVPYRTSPMPDLLGGHVDFTWAGTPTVRPLIASGQVRMLATSSANRLKDYPDVPTLTELGLKDVDVPAWNGLVAPRGMPLEVANRIHKEVLEAVKHPDFVTYIKNAGNDLTTTTPTHFSAYLKSEVERYRSILPPLGIRMD